MGPGGILVSHEADKSEESRALDSQEGLGGELGTGLLWVIILIMTM